MPDPREIDRLVAEKVMGYVWYDRDKVRCGDFCDCGFHPSTDPAADYRVLQHVRETWNAEQRCEFRLYLDQIWASRMPRLKQTLGQIVPTYDQWVYGDQYQPGDYSLAALAALGVEVKP